MHIGTAGIQHILNGHLLVLIKESVEGFDDFAGSPLLEVLLELGFHHPFEIALPLAVAGIANGGVGEPLGKGCDPGFGSEFLQSLCTRCALQKSLSRIKISPTTATTGLRLPLDIGNLGKGVGNLCQGIGQIFRPVLQSRCTGRPGPA